MRAGRAVLGALGVVAAAGLVSPAASQGGIAMMGSFNGPPWVADPACFATNGERVLAQLEPALLRCQTAALDATEGVAAVRLSVGPAGTVLSASAEGTAELPAALLACVERVAKAAQFAPPEAGGTSLWHTMVYGPRGGPPAPGPQSPPTSPSGYEPSWLTLEPTDGGPWREPDAPQSPSIAGAARPEAGALLAEEVRRRVASCGPPLGARIQVAFTAMPTGSVREPWLGASPQPAGLVECLATRLTRWPFRARSSRSLRVSLSFLQDEEGLSYASD